MKTFTFPAWCNFGGGDSGETWVDVELTEEEAERLEHFGLQADVFYEEFKNCEELSDIYQKVYAVAVAQITAELRGSDELSEEYATDPDWKADKTYSCGVNFPEEFEDNLIEPEEFEDEPVEEE